MKIKTLIISLLLSALSMPALANSSYLTASGGISILHDADFTVVGFGSTEVSYDMGLGFNVGLGYTVDNNRVELEFGYIKADLDTIGGLSYSGAEVTTMSYMVNGYHDFTGNNTITPFIGGGLGMINGELDDNGFTEDDTVLGYQLMGGISYIASPNLNLDLTYKLQSTFEDFSSGGVELEYISSSFLAGVRYNF
jgi:outer membrane immunogenic protein